MALTERFARSAEAGGRPKPIVSDGEVIGFGLQVRDNGRKAFTLDDTVENRRHFIGDHPAWSAQAARARTVRTSATAQERGSRAYAPEV